MSKENHPQSYSTALGWDGHQLTALSTLSLGGQEAVFTEMGCYVPTLPLALGKASLS